MKRKQSHSQTNQTLSNIANYTTAAYNKITKSKNFPHLFIILLIMGFWFYWTQIRVINIRKKCYTEVFTPTVASAKWSGGKVWTILYPAYDPAKGNRFQYSFWGWGYPETDSEATNYKRCLIWNGLVNPPDMN
jgi:hypothetical protein